MGTTGKATKGLVESLHNFNPNQIMGSTLRMSTGFFKVRTWLSWFIFENRKGTNNNIIMFFVLFIFPKGSSAGGPG
jgi:hypothetical protein